MNSYKVTFGYYGDESPEDIHFEYVEGKSEQDAIDKVHEIREDSEKGHIQIVEVEKLLIELKGYKITYSYLGDENANIYTTYSEGKNEEDAVDRFQTIERKREIQIVKVECLGEVENPMSPEENILNAVNEKKLTEEEVKKKIKEVQSYNKVLEEENAKSNNQV